MITVGIDEVGRGCWAGPLVVGVVALSDDVALPGLTDSKKLSRAKRESLAQQIEGCASIGLGWVSPAEIDANGLSAALRIGAIRALDSLAIDPEATIILDGSYNFLVDTKYTVECVVGADAHIPAVSAASIVAKVARDGYMYEQASVYTDYGFDSHVGYGTKRHKLALDKHGVTPLHRMSFRPVRERRFVV